MSKKNESNKAREDKPERVGGRQGAVKSAARAAKVGGKVQRDKLRLTAFEVTDAWRAHGRLRTVHHALLAAGGCVMTANLIARAADAVIHGNYGLALKQLDNALNSLDNKGLLGIGAMFRVEWYGPDINKAVDLIGEKLDAHVSGERVDHQLLQDVCELLEEPAPETPTVATVPELLEVVRDALRVQRERVFDLLSDEEIKACGRARYAVTHEPRPVGQAIARSQRDIERCIANVAKRDLLTTPEAEAQPEAQPEAKVA